MKNLVVLSYGREIEYRRSIFSVLSFYSWATKYLDTVRTIIFTDHPDYYTDYLEGLPVIYKKLTAAKLNDMLAGKDYIHRRKVAVIDEAFQDYPSEDVFFIDSDTFFISDPETMLDSLVPGFSIMHTPEYTFQEGVKVYESFNKAEYPKSFIKYIESRTFEVDSTQVKFDDSQISWNSGVLGLTSDIAKLIPDVYSLTDDFYDNTNWFISEQLAFGLVLQTKTEVLPCDQYVYHYWGQKQKALVDHLLEELFRSNFKKLDLRHKLAHTKHLIAKWQKLIEIDKLQEGSIYAFSNYQPKAGLKYALKAIAQSPFDVKFYQKLLRLSITKKNRLVQQ